MNTLTTRKIVFGTLMALVLAFSVQGIADARTEPDLPLSKTSGDFQTKTEGESFEIQFSIGIRNPTLIKNSDGKLIDDGVLAPPASDTATGFADIGYPTNLNAKRWTRIDNAGYPVKEINGKDYRLTTLSTSDLVLPSTPDGYSGTYEVRHKRPRPLNDYAAYTGIVYANSSRHAFSDEGYPLYYYLPAETGKSAKTIQITIETGKFHEPRHADNRYHYNQEAIKFEIKKEGVDDEFKPLAADDDDKTPYAHMDLFQSSPGFRRALRADMAESLGNVNALPKSLTLTCTPKDAGTGTAGTYTIKISDNTPRSDAPWGFFAEVAGNRAYIEFTLYVVKETPPDDHEVLIEIEGSATKHLRIDTVKEIERVNSRFKVVDDAGDTAADANLEILYRVVKGNGTLYAAAGVAEKPYAGPNQGLTIHQNSKVFLNMNGTDNEVSASIVGQGRNAYPATIVYEYSGSSAPTTSTPTRPTSTATSTSTPVTTVVPSSVTGPAGGTALLTVTANTLPFVNAVASTLPSANAVSFTGSGTTYTSVLALPSQAQTYTLIVNADGTERRVAVNVTAAAAPTGGNVTVNISPGSGAPGSTATVSVTAKDADGKAPDASVKVTLSITAGGGTFPNGATSTIVATDITGVTGDSIAGTAVTTLTRGRTLGSNYFITATVPSGYTFESTLPQGERFVVSGISQQPSQQPTTGEAAAVDVYDGNQQSGSLNSPLADPIVVEVVDANDNPVEDVRVRFQVTIGSGRFSPRTPRTDADGLAETTFTPTSAGRIRIIATVANVDDTAGFTVQGGEPADALEKVSGDNQNGIPGNALANPFVVEVQDEDGKPIAGHSVTFAVTAGGGSLSVTSANTNANGRAQTVLTLGSAPGVNSVRASVTGVDPVTFNTSIEPEILVAAAKRPVMYWIDSGALYRLAGAKAEKIAEGANGIAVGGGKVYWTSTTGASKGTINSANLDGTGVETLTTIMAVPMGIAVDTAGRKLYWTNTRGRLQSANLDGSDIRNVVQNLSSPTDIAVANGFIYWTQGGNTIRRVNTTGQKVARDVAANLDTVGGLAVGGGKVYWTERTRTNAGTVNGANLDGTNFETLATLLAAPMGISVDTAGSKLYWTNARGRLQSANLDGSMIQNVVTGLISPSKLVIGGANTETSTTQSTQQPSAPAADNSAYDVNGDGSVDNTDVALVAGAMNTDDAKYDFNGDGTVNFLDLLLIFDNRDDGAAAAPAIVGMKLNAIQIDHIQEQIDLLIATNDRSPAALRTLVYLQQLLVTARPNKTQLLANYPNPFNPETWIPYTLATDTEVKVTIYNTQGVVIRLIELGHQSAGYYTGRDRAAYWNGRNSHGELVASGIYFYQLETDNMSSIRKMVILK